MFRLQTIQGLFFLTALALVTGQGLLALICILLLVTAGVARLWDRWSLLRVSYTRELSQQRAFPGDEVELVLRIANRKPLPLIALLVRDIVPLKLEIVGHRKRLDTEGRQVINRMTSLRWYESIGWRYRLRCTARGAYRLGPVQLEGDDLARGGDLSRSRLIRTLLAGRRRRAGRATNQRRGDAGAGRARRGLCDRAVRQWRAGRVRAVCAFAAGT